MRTNEFYSRVESLKIWKRREIEMMLDRIDALPCNQCCPKCGDDVPHISYFAVGDIIDNYGGSDDVDGLPDEYFGTKYHDINRGNVRKAIKEVVMLTCRCGHAWFVPPVDAED